MATRTPIYSLERDSILESNVAQWREHTTEQGNYMTPKQCELIEQIKQLASWHCDEEADPLNESPEDQNAHVNGLIVKICDKLLVKEQEKRHKEFLTDLQKRKPK